MTISRTKLGAAIRSKFKSPRDLLRHLGIPQGALDQDLVNVGQPGASGDVDVAKAMRVDIENLLGGIDDERLVAAILEVMDKHVDPKRLDDDDPQAPRARAIAAGDDDNLANVERFRSALRNAGMAEEDISGALAMITRQDEAIGDKLPLTALFGGLGGRTSNNFRKPGALAGDERRRADYDQRFPSAIVPGFDYAPDRDRERSGKWPSDLADYDKRFGGSHIVTNG